MTPRSASSTRKPISGIEERRRLAGKSMNPSYGARRQEAVAAAAKLFEKKGYGATTLNDIAEAMGIDRATLYYYFRSKSELFREVCGKSMQENLAQIEEIAATTQPASAKLSQMLASLIDSFEESYPFGAVYRQEDLVRLAKGNERWAKEMAAQERQVEQLLVKVAKSGQAAGVIRDDCDPALIVKALLGMVMWTYRWFKPTGSWSATDVTKTFNRVLLEGIDIS
jgi:TetR/AcrR family transcriptional regulator, cholesterol catabolism regulator